MIGLSKTSTTKEIIDKTDENTAIRYRVVKEQIDLEALRQEKKNLEAQLKLSSPTNEELIEVGKGLHPYYSEKQQYIDRLEVVNSILGK